MTFSENVGPFFQDSIPTFCHFQDMSSILRESYRASLLYDGVLVFSQALKNIFETQDMVIPDVDCRDSEASYKQGKEILDEIEKVRGNVMAILIYFSKFNYTSYLSYQFSA